MNDHDLHDLLERLGREPVPPPRPEFVESLLARIQLTDDLREPAPVIYLRRQRWARARVAVASVAAAVLLGAVGMLALARGGSDSGVTGLQVRPVSSETERFDAEVDKDGRVEPDEGTAFGDLTGAYRATCREGGRVSFDEGSIVCEKGDELLLELEGGRIVHARPSAPTVGTQRSVETSTTARASFALEGAPHGDGLTLSWEAPAPAGVKSYAIERVAVEDATAPPPAMAELGPSPHLVVPASQTTAEVSFKDLQPAVGLRVFYRVFALDADGNVVGASANTVNVDWQPTSTTG